jgi:hypothetical protein
MAEKNKYKVVSSIGRAWPAHKVVIPLGESIHEDIPMVVLTQLLGMEESGLMQVTNLTKPAPDVDSAAMEDEELRILSEAEARKDEIEAKRRADRENDQKFMDRARAAKSGKGSGDAAVSKTG